MRIPILGFVGEYDKSFTVVPQQQLEQMIADFYKIPSSVQTTYSSNDSWYFDQYYTALPITKFKDVIEWWRAILSNLIYTTETFDCDDFAKLFSALLSTCGYNASGIVVGELYYNNEFVGYHAWNIILFVNPQGNLKLYEFEPQTAEILINHKSQDNFSYVGRWVIW